MLEDSSKNIVFGTDILLIGCKHQNTNNLNQPIKESKMYKTIESFSPEVILVEVGDFYKLNWLTHKTDIKTINRYLSENSMNRDNHIYKYDLNKDEYDYEAKQPSEDIQNTKDRRKVSRKETPRHFKQVLQIREENASIELMKFLGNYNRIVMHCGSTHYPVYKEHLKFLSTEH